MRGISLLPFATGPRLHGLQLQLAGFLLAALMPLPVSSAETTWRSIHNIKSAEPVCLDIAGQEFGYFLLSDQQAARSQIRGPRRLKIITRYLFDQTDPAVQSYTLIVRVDGAEVLRKAFTVGVKTGVSICQIPTAEVAALRRGTLQIGSGRHDVQVLAETPGSGQVAARLYRDSQSKPIPRVAYAPDGYDAVYNLQFSSGSQSTYYHFSADDPLSFTITGPTSLQVYTRLDFDHTMNGSQSYSLEVIRDGEPHQSYHYHTEKLSSAVYLERQDILPGSRKLMRLSVPKGTHRFEIRCLRPQRCGISAQIRIPQADIGGRS